MMKLRILSLNTQTNISFFTLVVDVQKLSMLRDQFFIIVNVYYKMGFALHSRS